MTGNSDGVQLESSEIKIVQRLETTPNVLLRGPPGTGKSRTMLRLQEFFEIGGPHPFESDTTDYPFEVGILPLSGNIRTEWLTFHQSTEYEDFVLGMRPEPVNQGIELEPYAGVLLSMINHVQEGNTGVIFIDEINRANVSKVFGEFISVMEQSKRVPSDGSGGHERVALTLPQLEDGEEIKDPITGSSFTFSRPLTVPQNLYVVASMNSLDRSTAPLDSALARRFEQISFEPDYPLLCKWLDVDFESGPPWLDADSPSDSMPGNIAATLLHRINTLLTASLGQDFQLGHGYLAELQDKADEQARLREIAYIWDGKLLPKLEELFRGREEQLASILRVDDGGAYYRDSIYESELGKMGYEAPVMRSPLTELDDDDLKDALWHLAGGSS